MGQLLSPTSIHMSHHFVFLLQNIYICKMLHFLHVRVVVILLTILAEVKATVCAVNVHFADALVTTKAPVPAMQTYNINHIFYFMTTNGGDELFFSITAMLKSMFNFPKHLCICTMDTCGAVSLKYG